MKLKIKYKNNDKVIILIHINKIRQLMLILVYLNQFLLQIIRRKKF